MKNETFFSLKSTRDDNTDYTTSFHRTFERAVEEIEFRAKLYEVSFELVELVRHMDDVHGSLYSIRWKRDGRTLVPWLTGEPLPTSLHMERFS